MIKRVWNFIKGLKDWLDLIVKIVAVIGIITGVFGIKGCSKHKQEKNNAIEIMTSEVTQRKSKTDKLVTETINWDIENSELKAENRVLKAQNSRYNKELIEANEIIKDYNIKAKNVDNYIKTEIETRSNYEIPIIFTDNPCEFKLEPINDEFLTLEFIQDINYKLLGIKRISRNTIYTVIGRDAKDKKRAILKKNIGKKHLFLSEAGWLWGWNYKTSTSAKDTNSVITNLVSIEFAK